MTQYDAITRTAEITVFGQTRTVEIHVLTEGRPRPVALTGNVFAAQIGRGTKRYHASMMLAAHPGGNPDHRDSVTDSAGELWQMRFSAVARNRQARIVGWEDSVTNEPNNARI